MPSADLLQFDSLLAPIPGAEAAGKPLPHAVRTRLEEARKEPDPMDPATASRRADWPGIIALAKETLAESSKDLLVAARLLEALAKKDGFAGLRDGLKLLRLMVETCWERMHPIPEEGEGMEVRVGPFQWLNNTTKGACFPATIAAIPLCKARGEAFGFWDWNDGARRALFEDALPGTDPKKLKDAYEDLQASMVEMQGLSKLLDEKLGQDAPDLLSDDNPSNIGQAITSYLKLIQEVLHRKGISMSDEPFASGDAAAAPNAESDGVLPIAGAKTNREALYRQLEQIADALQRIEPHSPIPYLVKRAVRLGSLPFPDLMRAMIRETGAIDELDRLLGLQQKTEQDSQGG
jgi:type VI secretion system protein ImpA